MRTEALIVVWGGFVVAFACLLVATIFRSSRSLRWFCMIGAFCGLLYEGGCMALASSIGRATGGGGNDTASGIVFIGFLVGVIWSILIILMVSADKKGNGSDPT
jgi:hypothetical protein